MERVAGCAGLIPYSVKFLARALYLELRRAGATEKEALKAAAGLVFTHFLVPSVEDPSVCGIIDFELADTHLDGPPAETLRAAARLLGLSASKRGYGPEEPTLAERMNPFVAELHGRMREIAHDLVANRAKEPEEHFEVAEFAASWTGKAFAPVAFMSIEEVCDTHR